MQDILNKILSNEEAAKKAEYLKIQRKRIVLANGAFDLLHSGHVNLLRRARDKGDVLFVAINSDRSIKTYKKPDRPNIPEMDRAVLVASLFFVDYVTIFNESKALNIIKNIKPDVLVKGNYYDPARVDEEVELVKKLGGGVVKIKHPVKISTSQIIERIRGVKID